MIASARLVQDRHGRRTLAAAILVAAIAVAAGSAPAWAHPVRSPERSAQETPVATADIVSDERQPVSPDPGAPTDESAPPVGVALAFIAIAALLVVVGRRRRLMTLGLALVTLVLAFETGVHSVHHLGSPQDASQCAVAVATTHVQGTVGEPVVPPSAPFYAGTAPFVREPVRLASPTWLAWRGRAPPFLSIT
jgi:hypothetical protein